MGPDWKEFVEELIQYFGRNTDSSWTGLQISRVIINKQIKFLEKSLKIMDLDEGVTF